MAADIKVYQGNQIGGCITVISTNKTRIVIDFGESLPGSEIVENIEFDWKKEKADAVFLRTIMEIISVDLWKYQMM